MIRLIPNDRGDIVGRAALMPTVLLNNAEGVLAAGGLRIMNYPNWAGILLGEVSKIDRRNGETHLSPRATAAWITVQVGLVHAAKLDPEEKARFADLALRYGASIDDLPIAKVKGSWVNSIEFARELNTLDQLVLEIGHLHYDGNIDNVPKWEFDQYFKPSDDIVFLPFLWDFMRGNLRSSPIGTYTLGICENIWGGYEEQNEDDRLVWHVHREEIRRQITVYRKPRLDKSQ